MTRAGAYKRQKADEGFRVAWDDAIAESVDRLEAAAFARAEADSDTLAKFLLSAHRPAVYRETVNQEHGGQVKITVNHVRRPYPGDQPGPAGPAPGPGEDQG